MAMKIASNFQGLNKPKRIKKGVFFTLDSILAGGIIVAVIIFGSSFYVKEQPSFHLDYLSQDLTRVLSSLTVEEINNGYIDSLGPSYVDKDNTVLEQIAEFWAKGQLEYAGKSASNVTDLFVPSNMGFGIWIGNDTIYARGIPLKKSLVSSKKIISGVEKGKTGGLTRNDPPELLGPVVVEVRVWQ